jgi:TELO2-interacting protein 1
MSGQGNAKNVLRDLELLLQTLKKPSITLALDPKLADYVFFPLSNVLRQLEKLPLRAQELTLECIAVLLRSAWRRDINPDLSTQLIILLTFLTDVKEGTEKTLKNNDEVRLMGFTCLSLVFQAQGESDAGRNSLVSLKNVPHIGKAVSVILESIVRKDADSVVVAALNALQSFCLVWPEIESLSMKFFPGIISGLTKVLNFKPSERRPYTVLVAALKVYSLLLHRVLGDEQIELLKQNDSTRIDDAWIKTTTDQVKISLSQVMKLRNHNNMEVRKAIGKLSLQCIEESWESLISSRDLLIDSLLSVSTTDAHLESQLRHLLVSREDIANIVRSSLYQKVAALPRTMHSTDDLLRRGSLNQVSFMLKLLADQGLDLGLIETILATNLRDSVLNIMQKGSKSQIVVDPDDGFLPTDLAAVSKTSSIEFEDVFSISTHQTHSARELDQLLVDISSQKCSINLVQELVSSIDRSNYAQQVSTLWIVLRLLRGIDKELWISEELIAEDANKKSFNDLVDEVYAFSLDILSRTQAEIQDWRLQALALEAIALQSHQLKQDFSPELIDCLYPIVQLMGSTNPLLQRHAQSCLNYVAQQSGYRDVGDMIVTNVDYLVNAVSIRLNTFEISPQAPQVLIMMVRLAGDSLLPYLDDIVDNVFTALECFHGYPKLVNLLFSALQAIVEEGSRPSKLMVESSSSSFNHDYHIKPTSMADLMEIFQARGSARLQSAKQSGRENDDSSVGRSPEVDLDEVVDEEPNELSEKPKPESEKLPTAHSILLNISKLTQHFLTTESLELRIRLLSLLKRAFPTLAKHEDSFLPLINTLWPVLLPRLNDSEAFVVSGALDVIALLCIHAKSFMTSRINDAWPEIRSLYQRCVKHLRDPYTVSTVEVNKVHHSSLTMTSIKHGPSDGKLDIFRPSSQSKGFAAIIWPSLVGLLIAITKSVNIAESTMDEILTMLLPAAKSQPEVLQALNGRNSDAVWLALHRLRKNLSDGSGLTNSSPAEPISRRDWHFADAR